MHPHHERARRLARALPESIEALLVTDSRNVRYLTGFTGSNGALLVFRDIPPVVSTDSRYLVQIAAQSPDLECVDARDPAAALAARAAAEGVGQLGVEATDVTLAQRERLVSAVAGAAELVAVTGLVEGLRCVKDGPEIAVLSRACAITDLAFADLLGSLRPGVSEREAAWMLETSVRAHGGDGMAFDSIVAFGPNSAIPHHEPSDRPCARGDLVKVDFGAKVDGYHADMTRTIAVPPVADWQRDLHAVVFAVQETCRAATVVGARPAELDELARREIEAAGHASTHGLGHGVGLAIHEAPFLTASSTADRLVAHVPVTIEPGVYLPGHGGVRIEDTVLLGSDGARALTTSPRELIELG